MRCRFVPKEPLTQRGVRGNLRVKGFKPIDQPPARFAFSDQQPCEVCVYYKAKFFSVVNAAHDFTGKTIAATVST